MRVAVLFGGPSVEHEVSVTSARGVARALEETAHECVPIGVTHSGRFLSPEVSRRILESQQPRVAEPIESEGGSLLLEPGMPGRLRRCGDAAGDALQVDVLFPLIHGWGGEDGRLQGMLDWIGIPYVGTGVLGSAMAMNKALAKRVCESAGLPGVSWLSFDANEFSADPSEWHRRVAGQLGFPVFVKPSNGGSSVGISRVAAPQQLEAAFLCALDCDRQVVVERAVPGPREIECAVLGNREPRPSVLGEIRPSAEFYDYDAKYVDGTSELIIPAPLDGTTTETIQRLAIRTYQALDLAGFARIDFLIERDTGRIFLNEPNTLPGFTPISMFPKLWEATGLSYPKLIERLIDLALEHHREAAGIRRHMEE